MSSVTSQTYPLGAILTAPSRVTRAVASTAAGRAATPLVRGVGGTLAARVLTLLCTFVAGVISARALGPDGRGRLALMMALPSLLAVCTALGTDSANLRFAGASGAAHRAVVRWSVIAAAAAAAMIVPAALVLAGLVPGVRLGLSPGQFLAALLLFPVALLVMTLANAELGRGNVRGYVWATVPPAVAYVLGLVGLAAADAVSLGPVYLGFASAQLLSLLTLCRLALRPSDPGDLALTPRSYVGYSLRAYVGNLAQFTMLRVSVPLVAVLAGTAAAGMYAVAVPMVEALLLLPVAVGTVLLPGVSSGRIDRRQTLALTRTTLALSALAAAVLAAAAPWLVPLLYGRAFAPAVAVTWLLLPGVVVFSAARTMQNYLAASDRLALVTAAALTGLSVAALAPLLVVPRFGAAGGALSMSLAFLSCSAVTASGFWPRFAPKASTGVWLGGLGLAATVGVLAAVDPRHVVAPAVFVVALVAGVVTLLWPPAGLVLACGIAPVTLTMPLLTSLAPQLIGALLLLAIVATFVQRDRGATTGPPAAGVLVLGGYALASAALPGGLGAALLNVLAVFGPLLVVPMLGRGPAARRLALDAFLAGSVLMAVLALVFARSLLRSGDDLWISVSSARQGPNSNVIGAVLLVATAIALARLARADRPAPRVLFVAILAALVSGLGFSFSRSAYAALLMMLLVFAVRRSVRGLALLGAGSVAVALVLPVAVAARVRYTTSGARGLDVSSAVRLDLWRAAWRMFRDRPVLGVGYTHFGDALPAYWRPRSSLGFRGVAVDTFVHAHSTYLSLLAELGLVGTALVVLLVAGPLRRLAGRLRSAADRDWLPEAALLACVGVLVASAFGEPLLDAALLVPFVALVCAAVRTGEHV